jgi:hypothetical protein
MSIQAQLDALNPNQVSKAVINAARDLYDNCEYIFTEHRPAMRAIPSPHDSVLFEWSRVLITFYVRDGDAEMHIALRHVCFDGWNYTLDHPDKKFLQAYPLACHLIKGMVDMVNPDEPR